MGKAYIRRWTLGWGIGDISLPLWKKKYRIQRKGSGGKCLENSWTVFNSIFMNSKGPRHTWKGCTAFLTAFSKKLIINKPEMCFIKKHWYVSPTISYGKILVLFFFLKYFPHTHLFHFSFDFFLMLVWVKTICLPGSKYPQKRVPKGI